MAAAPQADPWDFALHVYADSEVAAACLDAQDRHGQDVPLLLWAAWAGWRHGHVLSAAELAVARALAGPWRRDVVDPLRAIRRRLKHGPLPAPQAAGTLRASVKAAELEAERQLLAMLSALPENPRRDMESLAAMTANLAALAPDGCLAPVTQCLHSVLRAGHPIRGSVRAT